MEEERDPCTLSNSSLYVHSLVVVVLVVHALSLVPFDFCLPGFLVHSIAVAVLAEQARPICSEALGESWYSVCCVESLAVVWGFALELIPVFSCLEYVNASVHQLLEENS